MLVNPMMTNRQLVCLAALAKQSLVRKGTAWRIGRRGFSNHTVKALIERGLALRLGDRVIGVLAANDNGVGT
jgi:hypothetical protein